MPDYRAALGRGGDSMMGHLTPGEAVIPAGSMTPKLWAAYQEALDRQGMVPEQYVVGSGRNSINPMTGQPEFAKEIGKEGGQKDRPDERDSPSSGQPMVGAIHASPATASLQATGQLYSGPEGADRNLGATTGPREQAAIVDPNNLPNLTYDPDSGLYVQQTEYDFGPLMELFPGPIRAGMGLAGIDPTVTITEPFGHTGAGGIGSFPERPTSLGAESERERINLLQGLTQERAIIEQGFTRPELIPTPQFLGLSSAMSPLQMRTAIASRAIAGQAGEYTSPEAQTFYDNLLQRALIGDEGDLFGLDTLMPIDLQYLAQIRGIENPADTTALLAALQS